MRTERAIHSMQLPSGSVPEWVQILPLGTFAGLDGRGPYHLHAPQSVIDRTRLYFGSADIPVDYDHQLLWCRENGKKALAAGWIKELEARADGIFGRVEWTDAAAEHLRRREYRYLSPVYFYDEPGVVTRLESVALLNNPNLELRAVASRLGEDGGTMNLAQFLAMLAAAFGLPADSTAEAVTAHAKGLVDQAKVQAGHFAEIGKALGAPKDATMEQLAAHAKGFPSVFAELAAALGAPVGEPVEKLAAHAKERLAAAKADAGDAPDPGKYVPMAQFTELSTRLASLQGKVDADGAEKRVAHAKEAGKVSPAMEGWARAYASKDPQGFDAWLNSAPVILASGGEVLSGGPAKDGALSGEDRAICSQLGISPEDYKKTRDAGKEGQ